MKFLGHYWELWVVDILRTKKLKFSDFFFSSLKKSYGLHFELQQTYIYVLTVISHKKAPFGPWLRSVHAINLQLWTSDVRVFWKKCGAVFLWPNSIHHIHSHRHRTSICAVPTTVSYFNSGSRFRGSETLKISVRTSKQTWYLTYNSIQQLQLPSPSYVKNIFHAISRLRAMAVPFHDDSNWQG